MALPRIVTMRIRFLLRYPPIGKVFSSLFGLLEVPILDTIRFLDRHTRLNYFEDMMSLVTRVYGSRVIPLNVSLTAVPTVSPTEEILSIIRRVPALAIGYCYCRSAHKNCDNDVWTCIHTGTAQSLAELSTRMPVKSATVNDIEDLVLRADRAGLVHQLITAPSSDYFYVICNCCPCCCVMLRSAIQYGLGNTALASNFTVEHDREKCNDCGRCVPRCHFKARTVLNGAMKHEPERCVGCGLCVSVCENQANKKVRRATDRSVRAPANSSAV